MLGVVTPVPYVVTVAARLCPGCHPLRHRQAPARAVDAGPGPRPRARARLGCHQLDDLRDRGRNLVSGDGPPARALRRRRAGCSRGVLVADADPCRAHVLLGPRRHTASRHHAGSWGRLSASRFLPVPRRSSRHRPGRLLSRRWAANRTPSGLGAPHVRHHARVHRLRRPRRRAQRGELHVPQNSPRQLDLAERPRPLALVHRQRSRGGARSCWRHSICPSGWPGATMADRAGPEAKPAGPALHLHGWREPAVVGAALLAAAAGFGQFGAVAALGDVAKHFGHITHGATIAEQAGLSGTRPRHRPRRPAPRLPRGPAPRRPRGPVRPAPDDAHDVRWRPGPHRRVGYQPDLLVVRGTLRPGPAAPERHDRSRPGDRRRGDRLVATGEGRGAHRGRLRDRLRVDRDHAQPRRRPRWVSAASSCSPSCRWRRCPSSHAGSSSRTASRSRLPPRITRCRFSGRSDHDSGAGCHRRRADVCRVGRDGASEQFLLPLRPERDAAVGSRDRALIVGAGVTGLAGLLLGRLPRRPRRAADRRRRRHDRHGALGHGDLQRLAARRRRRLPARGAGGIDLRSRCGRAHERALSRPRSGRRSPGGRSPSASSAQPSGCWPSAPSPMSATTSAWQLSSCSRPRSRPPVSSLSCPRPAERSWRICEPEIGDWPPVSAGVPFGALGRRPSSNFAPNLPPIEIATGRNLFPKQVRDEISIALSGRRRANRATAMPRPVRAGRQYGCAHEREAAPLSASRASASEPPPHMTPGRRPPPARAPSSRSAPRARRHDQARGAPAHEGRGPGDPVSRSYHVVRERTEGRKRASRAVGELP